MRRPSTLPGSVPVPNRRDGKTRMHGMSISAECLRILPKRSEKEGNSKQEDVVKKNGK